MDAILAQLRHTPVTLEKHNRSVAVLVEPARFAAMQGALEAAADILFAFEDCRNRRKALLPEIEKRLKVIGKATGASLQL